MYMRTRILVGALTALALAGGTAGVAAAQTRPGGSQQMTFDVQLTAVQFITATGLITGYPTSPLLPGDRIVGQDRLLQGGVPVGHDDEVCTVGFASDVACQAIAIFDGRGDVQISWSFQWPATGAPTDFDGIIEGGTGDFADAHGSYSAHTVPGGDLQIDATLGDGR